MNKKKILLAPNSFKECADSIETIELIEKYLSEYRNIEVLKYPVSDGGDGFLNTLKYNFDLSVLKYSISTPYDDSKFNCEVLYDEQNNTIYIESAKVLGLQIIPKDKRQPLYVSSNGMGELLDQINNSVFNKEINVEKVVVGIGGTGTNDLGLGMCSVYGLKLLDKYGNETKAIPVNYLNVDKILWSKPKFYFNLEVIIDVNNPLLGKFGATHQFAKQKGATNVEIKLLETGFIKIVNILKNNNIGISFNLLSGAGGGLAAGLSLFFDTPCISSFENIKTNKKLNKIMEQVDYVITGEGVFDETSLLGKGASAVINLAE